MELWHGIEFYSMECGTFWTTSLNLEELPKYLLLLLFWFFFTWFMVEFWMYIYGQHNKLFDNVGVELKRVKCNFFFIIMFWIWKNREPAELVFIYLLFFQNINVVHKFFLYNFTFLIRLFVFNFYQFKSLNHFLWIRDKDKFIKLRVFHNFH